jgi:putative inorganic carbon (HCO3(-)) transporter
MAVLAGRRPLWLAGAALTGVVVALTLAISPLVTILLLLLIVGCVVIVSRPDIVLLVMVAALPWENKLNWPTATLSLTKAIGAVVFLAYILRVARSPRRKIHLPLILGVVVVFFCWILLSSVVSPDPSQDMQKTLRYALFISFFFLILQLVDGRVGVERVFRWFATSVGIAAIYGVVAFVLGSGGVSRAQGPLKDANDFAYLLACALPVVAYLIQTDRPKRLLWGFWFVAILGAMLATFSRGALVGIGALVIWGVLTRRVSLLAVVAGLATAGVVVLMAFTLWKPVIDKAFEQKGRIANQNAGSRLSYWEASLKLTARRPITGVGPDRFRVEAPPLVQNDPLTNDVILVPHNTYLDILSETGVPALLLFLAYLGLSWRQMRYVERAAIREGDLDGRRLAVALQAGLVVAIVSAMFLSEQLTSPFWLFPALALVLSRELDPHGVAGDLPPPETVPKAPAPAPRAGQPGPPVPVPA